MVAVKMEIWSREVAHTKRSQSEDWIGRQTSEVLGIFSYR